MSLASTPQHDLEQRVHDDCDHPDCSQSYQVTDGVAGHCSQRCADRHRGQKYLNTFRHDHRYCATCFARLKDVHSPGDDWRARKKSPLEYAVDQGGRFVDAGGGELVLDATDCGHKQTIDPDQVTGFQSVSEHGTIGLVLEETPDSTPNETRPGTICGACGNATLIESDDILRRRNIKTTVENLLEAAREVREEGQTTHSPTKEVLVARLREQYDTSGEFDFPRAVGRAINATEAEADE